MTKPKLTPLFPGTVKPVRKGLYQRRYECGFGYAMWTGKHWTFGTFRRDDPIGWVGKTSRQELPWRGLAQEGNSNG